MQCSVDLNFFFLKCAEMLFWLTETTLPVSVFKIAPKLPLPPGNCICLAIYINVTATISVLLFFNCWNSVSVVRIMLLKILNLFFNRSLMSHVHSAGLYIARRLFFTLLI